jgi:hypothetical protein
MFIARVRPLYQADAGTNGADDQPVAGTEQQSDDKSAAGDVVDTKDLKPGVAAEVAEEMDIEGLEKTDDGYTYSLGNSVYKGETVKEVMGKARKGVEDKDKASQELDRNLRELKAKRAIREPDELDDDDEITAPKENEIIASVFQNSGVEPRMMNWDDDKWLAYGEEKSLRDFQLNRMMEKVGKLKVEANQKLTAATSNWLNRTTLRSDITPAVQDMVTEAGVDPEQFGPIYLRILKDKQYTDASGLLNQSRILRAMHKEIMLVVKPAHESALAKKTAEEQKKLAEKKRALGSPGTTGVKVKPGTKEPADIREASRRALALLS